MIWLQGETACSNQLKKSLLLGCWDVSVPTFSLGQLVSSLTCLYGLVFCLSSHTRQKEATRVQFKNTPQLACPASINKLLCALITNSPKEKQIDPPIGQRSTMVPAVGSLGCGWVGMFHLTDGANGSQKGHLDKSVTPTGGIIFWPSGRRESPLLP